MVKYVIKDHGQDPVETHLLEDEWGINLWFKDEDYDKCPVCISNIGSALVECSERSPGKIFIPYTGSDILATKPGGQSGLPRLIFEP